MTKKGKMSSKYGFFYRAYNYLCFVIYLNLEILSNVLTNLKICSFRRRAKLPESLATKTIVITGANSGIGKECARTCARLGAKVIIAARDQKKAKAVIEEILNEIGRDKKENLILVELDLSSLDSVRLCAKQINQKVTQIDVLLNNAGVMMSPEWKTKDNYEYQLGTNHLGHFLLTNLLINKLKAAPSARIVNVSSLAHMTGQMYYDNLNLTGSYTPMKAYCRSKLANVLFTVELYNRLKETNITVYALHPGVVHTELTRHMNKSLMKFGAPIQRLLSINPEMGSQTSLYCAISEDTVNQSGFYYSNCTRVQKMVQHAIDSNEAAKLWNLSLKLCDIIDETFI